MKKTWFIKLVNYEYWPMWAFYLPLIPMIFFYGILKRHLFFFTNVNPGIDKFGGFFFDSKSIIDQQIPSEYRPQSHLIQPLKSKSDYETFVSFLQLSFPIILKPDAGERGKGVVKINTKKELIENLEKIESDYLIQEFITFQKEFGVFISYIPDTGKYKVISLTEKRYFSVKGDGKKAIQDLILNQTRGQIFFKQIRERSNYSMDYIPKENEICVIHTLGNHCNGTQFINRNDFISNELDEVINQLMTNLSGIYYGRFDIKADSLEMMIKSKQFKIIEFNGITAEPIHIYDQTHGYFNSLVSFISTWKYLYKISNYNKIKGIKPATNVEMMRKLMDRYG